VIESNPEFGRLVVTEEPVRIRFESEPFVLVQPRGYAPAAYVMATKTKKRAYLLLAASSICEQLEPLRNENQGRLLGVEVWIRKSSPEKTAKYVIE
jgi:hypothetical protein